MVGEDWGLMKAQRFAVREWFKSANKEGGAFKKKKQGSEWTIQMNHTQSTLLF